VACGLTSYLWASANRVVGCVFDVTRQRKHVNHYYGPHGTFLGLVLMIDI
jgi:hypothetical protein